MADSNGNTLRPFVAEVLQTHGGKDALQCYQCGTCSGSCPVIDEMDFGPRRILHMIQMGMEAEVLSSKDIWRCVSCYSCANRCPRGIEITDLMADLRRMALEKGYADDKEADFGETFAETLQTHGRLFEPELMARYYARVLDIRGLIGMVPMGLKMLFKGKLPLLPVNIEDREEFRALGVAKSTGPKFATRLRAWLRGRREVSNVLIGAIAGSAVFTLLVRVLSGFGKE